MGHGGGGGIRRARRQAGSAVGGGGGIIRLGGGPSLAPPRLPGRGLVGHRGSPVSQWLGHGMRPPRKALLA
jgi:hypothetical protein